MSRMEIKRPVTIDDMYHMPKDGQKYELVDGEIVVSPAGIYHAEIVIKIAHIIATFLDDHPIGKVFGDNVGLIFPTGNLRSPDVSFVRIDKLPGGKSPVTFGEFVPDLAVEVLSPRDHARQVADKIGEFLECGVQIVWVVDPKAQTVTAYRSLSNIQQFTASDTISAEPILPGFTCLVSRFFN
jgi:Uma2 family endonuclease